MHPMRKQIDQRLRVLIPVGIALEALVTVGLWVGYFYYSSKSEPGVASSSTWTSPLPWLALALVATVAGPPLLVMAVRNYVWLIRNGAEVPGYVKSISPLRSGGAQPVTFAYSVNGVEYTLKRDSPYARDYSKGTPVVVLVDPAKPKRATVLEGAK